MDEKIHVAKIDSQTARVSFGAFVTSTAGAIDVLLYEGAKQSARESLSVEFRKQLSLTDAGQQLTRLQGELTAGEGEVADLKQRIDSLQYKRAEALRKGDKADEIEAELQQAVTQDAMIRSRCNICRGLLAEAFGKAAQVLKDMIGQTRDRLLEIEAGKRAALLDQLQQRMPLDVVAKLIQADADTSFMQNDSHLAEIASQVLGPRPPAPAATGPSVEMDGGTHYQEMARGMPGVSERRDESEMRPAASLNYVG
jgi:hypothetical protein